MQKIYLLIDDEQKGPFSEEEVKGMYVSGAINPETLYWTESLSDWQVLGPMEQQAAEPKPAPKTIAPPRRTLSPGKYSVEHKPVKSEDEIEEELSRSSKPFLLIKIVAAIIVFFVVVTGLLKIISHTMPDLSKRFSNAVTQATNQQ